MPVTDLLGAGDVDPDWLQQFLAGHQAAQAFGAGQPYGAGAVPGPYSGGPQGLMPGGGLTGRQQMTPGAPSMGYPAMAGPQGQQPAPGLSLTNNPLTRALNYFAPIGSAQASVLHPDLDHPDLSDPMGVKNRAPPPSRPLPPGAADSLPLAWGNVTSQDYQNWLKQQLASSSAPAAAQPAPSRGGSGYGGVPPSGWGASASRGGSGYGGVLAGGWGEKSPPLPPPRPATGSPSQTPRPAASSADRWLIDRVNAGPVAQPRRGYQTALDLSQFFKRG